MSGAFDRPEPDRCSRLRIHRCCLLHFETASTLWFQVLSRLNALPACPPVNTSRTALRLSTHDSDRCGSLRLHRMAQGIANVKHALLQKRILFAEPFQEIVAVANRSPECSSKQLQL